MSKEAIDKTKCHVHIEAEESEKVEIRKKVCVDNIFSAFQKHIDEKYYCLLHLPSANKNLKKFEQVFQSRLIEVDERIAVIESNLLESEWTDAKKRFCYDFRYVWFPSELDLRGRKFLVSANFSSATFNSKTYFRLATFLSKANFKSVVFNDDAFFRAVKFEGEVDFSSVNFKADSDFISASFAHDAKFDASIFGDLADFTCTEFNSQFSFHLSRFCGESRFSKIKSPSSVNFISCIFEKPVYFRSIIFEATTQFNDTIFNDAVDFTSTTFVGLAEFKSVSFSSEVKFEKTKFSKTAETSFYKAKFDKDAFFDFTEFNSDVSFNSVVFGSDSDVIFRNTLFAKYVSFKYATSEGYLRFINLTQGYNNKFKFEEAAFEKTNRISFYNVRLQPHWFVNVNPSDFVFTNCRWKKANNKNINVESELNELDKIPNHHKLLTKTCWQLANNHEESNSFSKASMFRQFAQESKRREDSRWTQPFALHWWYWLTSFYGEMPLWALYVLMYLVLWIFPAIYSITDFQICPKEKPISISLNEKSCTISGLPFGEAIIHSLTTATLQNVEYRKPLTFWGELWIILEKIFAPLQAALLALAIRRKFMR